MTDGNSMMTTCRIHLAALLALGFVTGLVPSSQAQDPGVKGYRIGTCDWSIKLPASEESFRFAQRIGLDGIQYSFDDEGKGLDLRTRENRDKVRSVVRAVSYTHLTLPTSDLV